MRAMHIYMRYSYSDTNEIDTFSYDLNTKNENPFPSPQSQFVQSFTNKGMDTFFVKLLLECYNIVIVFSFYGTIMFFYRILKQ